jgi:hypothetical protein
MRLVLFTLSLLLTMVLPAVAEEFVMKDGTKIVGHMISITADTIEVETSYGKLSLKRREILSNNFRENRTAPDSSATSTGKEAPKIDDSLVGTLHTNRTGNFSLAVPTDWMINPELHSTTHALAGLSSRDKMRFLLVVRENYPASLDSYKGMVEIRGRRALSDYERLLDSHITIDGQSALLLSYRGVSTKAGNIPIHFLVAIIPAGTAITRISAWCAESLFNETQPKFEKILSSYHSTAETPPKK